MQAYMKSAMPYLGVRVPEVRRITRALAKADPPADLDSLEAAVLELWDNATYREERYAAAALMGLPLARGRLSLIPLYEHMAVTGAWWDHVDEIAHRIADLHDAHPVETAHDVRRWSTSQDMWLRRLSIISQLGRRDRVDTELLTQVIEPNMGDTEFFIRKAIGWALRVRQGRARLGAYIRGSPRRSAERTVEAGGVEACRMSTSATNALTS